MLQPAAPSVLLTPTSKMPSLAHKTFLQSF